jgi:hypothetical protein
MIKFSHTTLLRTSLEKWSARLREPYLTKQKTHKRQIFMTRRYANPQTQQARGHIFHFLDRSVTGFDLPQTTITDTLWYLYIYSAYEVKILYFMLDHSEIDKTWNNMTIVFRRFKTIEECMWFPLQNVSIPKIYLHMNIVCPWRYRQMTLTYGV